MCEGDIDKLKNFEIQELQAVDGIGDVVAEHIYNWFRNKKNMHMVEKLMSEVTIKGEKKKSGVFEGKTVVLTGTLPTLSRDEAGEMVRIHGGNVSSSVSSKTSYVLAGEKAGSKLADAERLGVKVLNEEEFLKIIR